MGIMSEKEKDYIENIIKYGKESTILDFKEEWYHFKRKQGQFEFIKDCISFLNVSVEIDKYIIIGVRELKDENKFTVVGVDSRNEENNIQEIIIKNIEPIPQIEIITGFKVEDREIDIIKIKKENKDQPYLIKNNFINKAENYIKESKGIGYIRHGSSSHQLSRNELTNMFFKKQGNIYGYFDVDLSATNKDYLSDIMIFLNSMDGLVNKEALDTISGNNLNIKSKIKHVFQELIIEGSLFNIADKDFENNLSRTIFDNKNEYLVIRDNIDDGENSLIILIFCACYNWNKIANNPKIDITVKNDIAVIDFDVEKISGTDYKNIDTYITNLNNIISDTNNVLFRYSKNVKIFKLEDIKYSAEASRYFIQSNIKFKVSEEIIPLLIEPLYKQSNKEEIALREMLQNSIDACKFMREKNYEGKIDISIEYKDNHTTLNFNDNGIGMDLEDIREYYLTVGKSKKRNSDLPVVGQFGIGALSMFLIGKKAVVRTKKSNDVEYRFELFEEKNEVANLTKKVIKNDESYTKIQIELNEDLLNISFDEVISMLSIDKWVLNKENFKVNFRIQDELYEVPNLENKKYKFEIIMEEKGLKVLLFNSEIEDENEKKSDNSILNNIIKKTNTVLYNDILVKSIYDFKGFINVYEKNIPFVVIDGKISSENMSIELSRNAANFGGSIAKSVAEKIYDIQIKKIKEYLNENQGKTNSVKMRNELIKMVQNKIKLPVLLLSENKIIISNSQMYDELVGKCVFEIKSNSLNDDCINFNKDIYFTIDENDATKSKIADMIEWGSAFLISKRYLYKFIINADNSSNGFRTNALRIIMRDILPKENWELEYINIWHAIKMKKDELVRAIEDKSIYGIYCYKGTTKQLVERIFNEKIVNRDLIVTYSMITQDKYNYSFDKMFDKKFIEDIKFLEEVAVSLE